MDTMYVQEMAYWFCDMLFNTILILESHKTTIFLALVVALLTKMKMDQISESKIYKFPVYPSSLPILGHVHHVYGDGRAVFKAILKFLKLYSGEPMTVDLINRRYVLFTSAHHSEIVLKSNAMKSNDYKAVESLMGNGMFTTRDLVHWKRNRRIISPFFRSFKFISKYIPVYLEEARAAIDKMPVGQPFNIFHLLGRTTLTVICRTGIGVECRPEHCEAFITDMERVLRTMQQRLFRPWLMIDCVFRRSAICRSHDAGIRGLRDFAWQMVQRRREIAGKEATPTFVDALLEEYNVDDADDATMILDEVMTILVGGQETTATAISFTLIMLAMHPHVQEKAYQEVVEVLKGRSDKEITFNDFAELKYLDYVINETLRLFPALPLIVRELNETTDFGDCILPKGLSVPIFTYETHRKPEVWGKFAEEFRPERFAPEEASKRPHFSYLPFSSGIRYCVGKRFALLQMKTLLSTLISHFKFETAPGLGKMDDIQLEVNTTLKLHGGFNIVFQKRLT